jgi:hypothetical protein
MRELVSAANSSAPQAPKNSKSAAERMEYARSKKRSNQSLNEPPPARSLRNRTSGLVLGSADDDDDPPETPSKAPSKKTPAPAQPIERGSLRAVSCRECIVRMCNDKINGACWNRASGSSDRCYACKSHPCNSLYVALLVSCLLIVELILL